MRAHIEPELLQPPPRHVRLTKRMFPISASLSDEGNPEFTETKRWVLEKAHPFLSILFLMPAVGGLLFCYRLAVALLAVRGGRQRFVDMLPLVFVTLIWNGIAVSIAWNGFVAPMMIRRIVMYGELVIGRVTEIVPSQRGYRIAYSFDTGAALNVEGWVVVPKKEWEESGRPENKLTILYSQSNPKWNIPYVFSGYRIVT